jgi:hypothetical protein
MPRGKEHIMSEEKPKTKSIDRTIPDPETKELSQKRRYLTSKYKLRILSEVDDCKNRQGDVGALLRREGLYSSHLSSWRNERDQGRLSATSEVKRGRKRNVSEVEKENLELHRELEKLKIKHEHALMIIEAQKKIAAIFERDPQTENLPKSRLKRP